MGVGAGCPGPTNRKKPSEVRSNGYFKENYHFPRFQRGPTFCRGGGPTFSRGWVGSNSLFL